MSTIKPISRRKFLRLSGAAAGSAVLGGAGLAVAADAAANATKAASGPGAANGTAPGSGEAHGHAAPSAAGADQGERFYRGRMYFTNQLEFSTLSEATERIFPKDDSGPGAKDLFVPYFIDNQLAGAWGHNAREYTIGPYGPGEATQGYQTRLLRKDVFVQGLAALNREAHDRHGKTFPNLTDGEKDAILKRCEAGDIPMEAVSSSYFFSILREATIAGVYADPIYAGNDKMNGWRLKQYPGAQMGYHAIIASETFEVIEPMSLADMQ